MAMTPAALPLTARKIAVAPSARRRSASVLSADVSMFNSVRNLALPSASRWLSTYADDALTGGRVEAAHRAEFELALGGQP